MNKSLEFVKKRLKEMGMNWDYKDEDVDIHSSESVFRRTTISIILIFLMHIVSIMTALSCLLVKQ